ncbi:FmdB family zinc ribbon protein [Pseudoalteromonas sp.]|uniref:FmdB family zinc ribbon protein n=1 Tax=Pseudoalteromonas sp. TaxID=53249 RepID=UPI00345DB4CA|nr:hypothetical protein [Pseudoalteromonas sp.]
MITYNYKCQSCDKQYDVKQRITEDPLTKCEYCGAKRLIRNIGVNEFYFCKVRRHRYM